MIVEYIRYTIPESEAEAFIASYTRAQDALLASSHCLGWELSRCTEDATRFILRIQWDSAEGHMQGFRKSPEFARFFAEIRPYVGRIEEMRHYALTPVAGVKR
ncbi:MULTISPECIES: putative quinol monooxygenase [Myxococcaceae]|uniref:putative quinol monooxygenase n=1 Tax=Myxococcaceae TaxID=31 RepID=UPI000EDB7363|nr:MULTISPECIES: antibiotic biosynthesis monooxygenase family protein [Myxococcaceae]RKH92486.1 antibiotic biosynthesis monooxygenase [Corallococcus sp. AB038B]